MKYTFNVRLHGAQGGADERPLPITSLDPGLDGWAAFPTILPDTPEVTHHPFPGEIDDLIDAIRRTARPRSTSGGGRQDLRDRLRRRAIGPGRTPVKLPLP